MGDEYLRRAKRSIRVIAMPPFNGSGNQHYTIAQEEAKGEEGDVGRKPIPNGITRRVVCEQWAASIYLSTL